ncbi:hypothetical protein IIA28_02240, partial [candidate division KSB1 bacterium]|nr:hypothetical protein [candidate division KSB1 bacterium]
KEKPLSPLDRHKGKTKKDFLFALGININGEKYNSLASKIQTKIGEEKFKQMGEDLLEKTFNLFTHAQNKDTAWINYSVKSETAQYEEGYLESLVNDSTSSNLNLGSFLDLFGQTTGDIKTNLARILLLLQGTISPQINVEFIPAFRKIGNPKSTIRPKDRSGEGWLSYLADIQNPDYDSPEKEEQYNKINDFLKNLNSNKENIYDLMDPIISDLGDIDAGTWTKVFSADSYRNLDLKDNRNSKRKNAKIVFCSCDDTLRQ